MGTANLLFNGHSMADDEPHRVPSTLRRVLRRDFAVLSEAPLQRQAFTGIERRRVGAEEDWTRAGRENRRRTG